jgi:hypothetical protein
VVTTLFADGDEALEDIARFVGRARPATPGGSVKRLGRRPRPVPSGPPPFLMARTGPTTRSRRRGYGITPANLGATLGATARPPEEALPDGDRSRRSAASAGRLWTVRDRCVEVMVWR